MPSFEFLPEQISLVSTLSFLLIKTETKLLIHKLQVAKLVDLAKAGTWLCEALVTNGTWLGSLLRLASHSFPRENENRFVVSSPL